MYMLVQASIYFAGRQDVYTWSSQYLLYWKKRCIHLVKSIFTLPEEKRYTLGQVNIYFTGRKDVCTGEKLIKLKKEIKRIQLKLHVNYICSNQNKSG